MPGTILADRYRIMEIVGRGGMGEVWVSEQLKPIRQKVALKIVRRGMDSKQILARFESGNLKGDGHVVNRGEVYLLLKLSYS